MWKNPCYLYGQNDIFVPANLNFGDFILSKLWENQERVAIINGETQKELRSKEMAQEAMSLAISLTRIGVRKGEVVAICSENRQEFWSIAVGVICTGAVATFINLSYTGDELKHVLSISKPKFAFCSPQAYKNCSKIFAVLNIKIITFGVANPKSFSYENMVNGFVDGISEKKIDYEEFLPVDVQGHETAFLLYSSGTTGLPKGVMLSHLNMLAMCMQPDQSNTIKSVLVVTPWYHSMGLSGGFSYLTVGRTIVYLPRFDPSLYLKTIEKYKVEQITVVPPMLVAITKFPSNYDLSSVILVYSGAAPLRNETINEACSRFPNAKTVLQGYGLTETTLAVCKSYMHEKAKVGSVGKVMRGSTIKIVDIQTRKPLGKLQEGEICVKGPIVMKGYVNKDRRDDFDDEGFFKTGDIAYYDEEGYVFIVGRLKELIKYKGHQVPPAEIEAVLLQHRGIRDAGVIGVPDDAAGEVPRAFVVLQLGATLTENDVKQFVAKRLSSPKRLRGGVQFVSQIPKTPSGKILRSRLREMVEIHKSKL